MGNNASYATARTTLITNAVTTSVTDIATRCTSDTKVTQSVSQSNTIFKCVVDQGPINQSQSSTLSLTCLSNTDTKNSVQNSFKTNLQTSAEAELKKQGISLSDNTVISNAITDQITDISTAYNTYIDSSCASNVATSQAVNMDNNYYGCPSFCIDVPLAMSSAMFDPIHGKAARDVFSQICTIRLGGITQELLVENIVSFINSNTVASDTVNMLESAVTTAAKATLVVTGLDLTTILIIVGCILLFIAIIGIYIWWKNRKKTVPYQSGSPPQAYGANYTYPPQPEQYQPPPQQQYRPPQYQQQYRPPPQQYQPPPVFPS